jgi:hypothetical protein
MKRPTIDLRYKIRKRPVTERMVLVQVENVPRELNSEIAMGLLARKAGGVVRRIDCNVDRDSCQVVFIDEEDAASFHAALNKVRRYSKLLLMSGCQCY